VAVCTRRVVEPIDGRSIGARSASRPLSR